MKAIKDKYNPNLSVRENAELCNCSVAAIRHYIKVNGIDERLTTVLATKYLLEADISRNKRKKVIDQQSAVIILENYMERRKNGR